MRERPRLVVEAAIGVVGLLVFILLAHASTRTGHVVSFDDDVSRWAASGLPAGVEWVAKLFTWLGGAVGTAVVAGAATLLLWRSSRRLDASLVALSVVGITAIVAILKSHYERARPDLGSPIALPHSFSFPSGHAATAVVLYGVLGILAAERASSGLRAAGWLLAAAALALAIGWSRVILDVHYVSDVVAGFAIGLAWLSCCCVTRDVLAVRREAAASAPRPSS